MMSRIARSMPFLMSILIALIVVSVVVIIHDSYRADAVRTHCQQLGGVWIRSERVCVKSEFFINVE